MVPIKKVAAEAQAEVKQQDESPSVFKFERLALEDRLNGILEHLNGFIGQKGHNPFLYINKHIAPLAKRLQAGEQSKELSDAIMALEEKPTPTSNLTSPEPEPVKQVAKLEPIGLKFPPK